MKHLFDTLPIDKDLKECKGLIFRGYSYMFYSHKAHKIEWQQGIRLLKKKSCKGCEQCGWIFDTIDDLLSSDGVIFPIDGIVDKELYTITVVNERRDWESGVIDSWDFKIVEKE